MIKKLLILLLVFPTLNAQQLSPVQLQKIKTQFDQALKIKKFDEAQTYLNQMEKGGRRANALELSAELTKARQKETQAKYQTEQLKGLQAEAKRVMETRKVEQQAKELEENKKQSEKSKKENEEQAMEITQLKQKHLAEIEQAQKAEATGYEEVKKHQLTITDLQNQIQQLRSTIPKGQEESLKLKQQIEQTSKLSNENAVLARKLKDCNDQLQAIAPLNAKSKQLEQENVKLKEENSGLNRQLSVAESHIKTLDKELSTEKNQITQLSAQIKNLNVEIGGKQQELEEIKHGRMEYKGDS